ncbi:hypothetical protein AOQ84DRAFT_420790 [Glonium stellatum]|uniref:Uncharacterized protein n=1 Tax=Glonium stellatum TaxID=574774 RepID=A0A8E2F7V2_9PEZI|nr:hypothetical protein AOQ84DRAFT_420790 [Glonium stellatum]
MSKADRVRIRRQAMKAVGISRRQRGNYGQHNLRQYPVYEIAWANEIPAHPSSKGFELMRIEYGVDILDLSGLITIHVGRTAAQILASDRALLARLLQCKQQWSYLSYLPSRYGYSDCLDDATRCVAAKMRQIVLTTDQLPDATVLSHYGKALKSLQAAVNDPVSCLKSDILCATEILALFELLSFSSGDKWKHHMAGAAQLIKLRGPQNYSTNFDQALFMALAGLILTEAIMNNERCFLERDEWQEVLRSMIVPGDTLADRSPIVISLWSCAVYGAGLFKDVTSAIFGYETYSHTRIENLIRGGLHARERFLQWRRDFDALPESTGQNHYNKRYQVLGVFHSCLALTNRLIGAIDSSRRTDLEFESQALASEVARMESEAASTSPVASFFLSQKMKIAQSILDTATTWNDNEDEPRDHRPHENLIEKWKFGHWCLALGRVTCCTN